MLALALLIAGTLAAAMPAQAAGASAGEPLLAKGMTTSVEAQPVKALHYGDTLFNFFQDRHFSAVTGLMTSQHFNRLAPQGDEAEVLRGGLLLSYGVHGEAGQIFASLIEKGAAPSVRDRAWYYLAKIRYQRGFNEQAEGALARIEGKLPGALVEEHDLLKAQLLMARGDFHGAAAVLSAMGTDAKKASAFARFNLGVALLKGGDAARGIALLDEIGRAPAENEEQRSLRDRTNLALGLAALQEQRADDARRFLERVRLNGLHANKALLGFGWASAAKKDHALALVSWRELAGREASDPAVLEARIAAPYAHAEMGAFGQSLKLYEEAVTAYDGEAQRLDASIAVIRSGKLIEGLLERNPADEMGWFGNLRKLPEMPHTAHLSRVLSEHAFQEAFKNVRDLRFLESNLMQWRDTLGVFREMLDNRRKAYADRLAAMRDGARAEALALTALRQRRNQLTIDVARAELEADGAAYADARERALLTRVEGLQAALKMQSNDPDVAALSERVRLTAGVLAWELAQALPARRWAMQKSMTEIDRELDKAGRREIALAQAQRDEPARFDGFAARIEALSRQLDAALPRVVALKGEQQRAAEQVAEAALVGQKERLQAYTTQARFEIALLIDRATVAKGDDHARR